MLMKIKRKTINIKKYNKVMDDIMKKKLPVHETLIAMLDYAASVEIVDMPLDKPK